MSWYVNRYHYEGDIEQGRYRTCANRAAEIERAQGGNNPTSVVTAGHPVSLRDEQVRAVVSKERRNEAAKKRQLL